MLPEAAGPASPAAPAALSFSSLRLTPTRESTANAFSHQENPALARPELDRIRSDARGGAIRKLYVFKLDWLTRSGIRDTCEVIEELRAHGGQVVSVADGFDIEGPAAEVVLAVMAWAAKMERIAINERISAARGRLEAEGKRWGRPARLGKSERERALAMRAAGRSIREIAGALKVPKSTVARALSQYVAARPPPRAISRGLSGHASPRRQAPTSFEEAQVSGVPVAARGITSASIRPTCDFDRSTASAMALTV